MRSLIITIFIFTMSQLNAQTTCDSLQINISYSPFTDTLIEVSVVNNSSQFFSYPGFILLSSNGDTIAKEDVNLFGIGNFSTHFLQVYPGMITSTNFIAELQLWTNFYSNFECSWNLNVNLCPDTCVVLYPYLINMGGAISTGTINYSVLDSNFQIVASGALTLDNFNQEDRDTICLPPGNYSIQVDSIPLPMAGGPVYGISNTTYYSGGVQMFYNGSSSAIPFQIFESCQVTYIIEINSDQNNFLIFNYNGLVEIINLKENNPAEVFIYNKEGKILLIDKIHDGKKIIDLSGFAKGIYFVELKNKTRIRAAKVLN